MPKSNVKEKDMNEKEKAKKNRRYEYTAMWVKRNPEKMQAIRKRGYEKHKEKRQEEAREYYYKNREAILECFTSYQWEKK